ncbi:MAG: acyltransferase [Treponema sp.]|nr:acyltransferase [Treponema sp.]
MWKKLLLPQLLLFSLYLCYSKLYCFIEETAPKSHSYFLGRRNQLMTQQRQRNYSIDFWRILFTYLVILYHLEIFFQREDRFFECCYLSVEFFFILSGFFMARHAENDTEPAPKRASCTYIFHRFRQLYPAFLVAWTASFLSWILKARFVNAVPVSLVRTIQEHVWELSLLWMLVPGNKTFVYVSWYISSMLIASYFIYWLLKAKKNTSVGFIFPLSIILIYSFFGTWNQGIDFHYDFKTIVSSGLLRAFAGLSIGCISFYVFKNVYKHLETLIRVPYRKFLLSICELLVILFLIRILFGSEHSNLNFIAIPLFMVLLMLEFGSYTFLSDILNKGKFFGFLGKTSIGAYLNQEMLFPFFASLSDAHPHWNFTLISALCLVVCTLTGIVSYYLILGIKRLLQSVVKPQF